MFVAVFMFGVPSESRKLSTFSSTEIQKQYQRNPIILADWSACQFVIFYPSELSARGAEDVQKTPKYTHLNCKKALQSLLGHAG